MYYKMDDKEHISKIARALGIFYEHNNIDLAEDLSARSHVMHTGMK